MVQLLFCFIGKGLTTLLLIRSMPASEKLLQLLTRSQPQRISSSSFFFKKKNVIKLRTYKGTDAINLVAAGCFNEICSAPPRSDSAQRHTDTDCSEARKLLTLKAALFKISHIDFGARR